MNCYEMVREFHLKNGQLAPEIAQLPMPMHTMLLRQRLILEELGETSCAMHLLDIPEIADGLTDLAYVVYGTAVSCGVFVPDLFITVKEKNPGQENVFDSLNSITCCVYELLADLRSATEDSEKQIRMRLVALLIEINTLGGHFGFPMQELFAEVHSSNMSKNLGGAEDGKKYGSQNPKGVGYHPPRIKEVLGIS